MWPFDRRARRAAVNVPGQTQPAGGIVAGDFRKTAQPWQDRARMFARMGLVRFAYGLEADLASRCPLVPEYTENGDDWTPQDATTERAALAPHDVIGSYRGERESQEDLIRRHVWLRRTIGERAEAVYSTQSMPVCVSVRDPINLTRRGDVYVVRDTPNGRVEDGTAIEVPANQVRRLWIPDDEWPGLATSNLAGLLDDLDRYHALGRAIARGAKSRMVVNGAVWSPQEAQRAINDEQRVDGGAMTDLDQQWVELSKAAYNDLDDSAGSAMPLHVHWSHEYGPPIFVPFDRPFDGHVLPLRAEALECVARGLPLPAQLIIEGPGAGGNHWGDWLADEHQSRIISGQLDDIVHGDITESFFRPALRSLVQRGLWAGDPERWRVGYDLTPIVVHPDRSQVAIELWQLGAIGLATLLRECGFDATQDLPTPADLERLALVLQMRSRQQSQLPGDQSTVVKAPPVPANGNGRTASLQRRELVPFPAERGSWS